MKSRYETALRSYRRGNVFGTSDAKFGRSVVHATSDAIASTGIAVAVVRTMVAWLVDARTIFELDAGTDGTATAWEAHCRG